jgi:hypothetical protein
MDLSIELRNGRQIGRFIMRSIDERQARMELSFIGAGRKVGRERGMKRKLFFLDWKIGEEGEG